MFLGPRSVRVGRLKTVCINFELRSAREPGSMMATIFVKIGVKPGESYRVSYP